MLAGSAAEAFCPSEIFIGRLLFEYRSYVGSELSTSFVSFRGIAARSLCRGASMISRRTEFREGQCYCAARLARGFRSVPQGRTAEMGAHRPNLGRESGFTLCPGLSRDDYAHACSRLLAASP